MLSRIRFRTKIELGIAALVVGTALLLAWASGRTAADALKDEHHKRGRALVDILAARSIDPLLAQDLLHLKNVVDDLKRIEGDILYVFVLDEAGQVVAHTFTGGFPADLLPVNSVSKDSRVRTQLLKTNGQLVDDFAAAAITAGDHIGTARLGISRTSIQAAVNRLFFLHILIAVGVLGIALGAGTYFSRRVTARINVLKNHAEEVVKGNLDLQTGPTLKRNCWEIMDCKNAECPAFGDVRRRCWHVAGTMCEECEGKDYPDKLHSCRSCKVYRQNVGDEIQDLAEAFDVMALILKSRIEELKLAEQSIKGQQQLMRTILDVTPDLVSLLDDDLVYRQPNKAFAASVGRSVEGVVGKTDFDLFPPEVAALRQEKNREVLATRQKVEMESSREAEGGTRWYHTVIIPVTDNDGRITGVLRTARDVTEIKSYQGQLIQAQKMESLGKMAGGVAHEINTPLGIILGYAQLLQDDVPPDSQMLADLKTIEKQAKVCRKIVADLLGFSRQHESHLAQMNLNQSVEEVVTLVRNAFYLDQIEIVTDLGADIPLIIADGEKLKQVWMNMLDNSLDAMGRGGLIVVKSWADQSQKKATISFADTGSGISPEDMKRIFDPFFTTKPVDKGTGLGLAVSFGIVKAHGGAIRAISPCPREYLSTSTDKASPEAQGTVFLIELPFEQKAGDQEKE